MVRGDTEVPGPAVDEAANRGDDTADSAYLAPIPVAGGRQCMEVPKQLVGAVDQIDVQISAPVICWLGCESKDAALRRR